MTTLLHESRALLQRWQEYYSRSGSSAGLFQDTADLIQRLPPPLPRYIPTEQESERMERNGET